ncbi:MAG: HD domain-containing phosphohydrolase [Candidatus Omnitrophota bacterium]
MSVRSGRKDTKAEKNLKGNLRTRVEELTALYDVSKTITSSMDLGRMLRIVVSKVKRVTKSKFCAIHLLKRNSLVPRAVYGSLRTEAALKQEVSIKEGFYGFAVKRKRPCTVRDLSKFPHFIFYRVFKKMKLRSMMVVPMIERGKVIGTLSVISDTINAYTNNDAKELSLFASQAAAAIENARLFRETKTNYLNTMRLLASVIDAKDSYTEDHSEKVMRYAMGIAKNMDLPEGKRRVIKFASILHDIGKINIDISILRKSGPLTKNEWQKVVEHPRIGAEILGKAGFLKDLIPAILYHHLKYEGGGYPKSKIRGKSIPIEARILAVADAYEAMTSSRPYRSNMTKEQAIEELKRCAGTQFDPVVVKAFLNYCTRKNKI